MAMGTPPSPSLVRGGTRSRRLISKGGSSD
jgi:hypothetical protein